MPPEANLYCCFDKPNLAGHGIHLYHWLHHLRICRRLVAKLPCWRCHHALHPQSRCRHLITIQNAGTRFLFFFFFYRLCSIKDAAGANPQPGRSVEQQGGSHVHRNVRFIPHYLLLPPPLPVQFPSLAGKWSGLPSGKTAKCWFVSRGKVEE